jgi:hypothetical protein
LSKGPNYKTKKRIKKRKGVAGMPPPRHCVMH